MWREFNLLAEQIYSMFCSVARQRKVPWHPVASAATPPLPLPDHSSWCHHFSQWVTGTKGTRHRGGASDLFWSTGTASTRDWRPGIWRAGAGMNRDFERLEGLVWSRRPLERHRGRERVRHANVATHEGQTASPRKRQSCFWDSETGIATFFFSNANAFASPEAWLINSDNST